MPVSNGDRTWEFEMSSDPVSPAEDREAIREILSTYVHHLDARRFDDVAALFTANGEWRSKLGAATGHRDIEALLRRTTLARDTHDGPKARRHFVANSIIALKGNTAQVVSSFFVLRQTDHGLAAVSLGTYNDLLMKEPTVWRFHPRDT